MTNEELFESCFVVNSPEYRGAPMPEFDPNMVNESEIDDGLRFKEYTYNFDEENDSVEITWVSQSVGDVNTLFNEIYRWGKEIGLKNYTVTVDVYARDGDYLGGKPIEF